MHLYHFHTKINIPSLNNEDQCPRQEHHNIVISLLMKMAAVILAQQHRQIQCTMDWYSWGKTGNYSFFCCLSRPITMQFCVTKIFYSFWVVSTKNFIHELIRVMVVMAVDYPILCGPCTNINILFFSGNKNNVITCHLLFILDCRWSHSHCERCIHMNK